MTFDEAYLKLKKYGQEHLLDYYGDLKEEERENLLKEIDGLNVEEIHELYRELVLNKGQNHTCEITSMESTDIRDFSEEERKKYYELGMEALRKGEVAILQVAGGQGSRLGFSGPKGTFSVGLPSNKELFRIQAERVKNISERAGHDIPWYIMTSPENNDATEKYFKDHNFFNLSLDSVKFFKQTVFPSVDEEGKIFLDSKYEISKNPNGSGGCFTSLRDSGYLQDMKRRKIKYVFFCGVDNILVRMADPIFIGFGIDKNFDITSKSVRKVSPLEKVGVFSNKDGKPGITEYIELSEELAKEVDENGKLLFGSGNILTHLFKFSFLEKVLSKKTRYYAQYKKIKHYGKDGTKVAPETPNGYKFESLYFDTFCEADGMAILDIVREDEFAPVKNKEGNDSVDTARELYLNQSKRWLENIGINLQDNEVVEVSPLLAYYGDELKKEDVENKLKGQGEVKYIE